MRDTVEGDPGLAGAFGLPTSVPGVGPIPAATLPAGPPEPGRLDRRRVAAPVGVAPIARDGGRRRGRRVAAEGRARVRRVLHTAAVAISRRANRPASFHERSAAEGRPRRPVAVVPRCSSRRTP
jgi:transposase